VKIDVAQKKLNKLLNDEKKLFSDLQRAPNLETKKRVLQNYENQVTRLLMDIEKQKSDPEFKNIQTMLLELEEWLKGLKKKGILRNIQERGYGMFSNYWEDID